MSTNDKAHGSPHGSPHGSYVEKVREETQSYVRTMLHENHELREAMATLTSENERLREALRAREAQESELSQKLEELRNVSEQYATQFAQLEQHNANLANLYVASYQLHGTLDRDAVLVAMQEIIVNLIGSEEFAIAERGPDGGFRTISSIGAERGADPHHDDLRIAHSTGSGELWVRAPGDDSSGLTACIPLKLDGRVTGYVAIYRLLAHKATLEPLDHELLDLLATHAATALHCTSLAQRVREAEGAVA